MLRALAIIAVVATGCSKPSSNKQGAPATTLADIPTFEHSAKPTVLVELFTSQGCSSCPPADRILSTLAHDDIDIIPLAFHVDYWNYIGWRDPFSDEQWSSRQRAYADRMNLRGVYTPQLVVDGADQMVGSRRAKVVAGIEAAVGTSRRARVAARTNRRSTDHIELTIDAELGAALQSGSVDLMLATFEDGIVTEVSRGENAGRSLTNDHIVRRLDRAFTWTPGDSAARTQTVRVDLDETWSSGQVGVVAFVQDTETMQVYSATIAAEASPSR